MEGTVWTLTTYGGVGYEEEALNSLPVFQKL